MDMNSDGGLPSPYFPCIPDLEEWKYSMRRYMQEIVPGVYLGPYSAAMKTQLDSLKSAGITHIICVRHSLEAQIIKPNFEDHFKYLILEIADSSSENIIRFFPVVKTFINETLAQGGKVLVHGNAGISRSAALVLAYIMEKYKLTFREASFLAQQKRFCINPNQGFVAQLREFEPIYQAYGDLVGQRQPPSGKLQNKRTLEQIED